MFTYPSVIRLKAAASDADGMVVAVALYERTNLLGTVNQAPYNYNVYFTSLFDIGSYVFTAKATDDRGASSVSSPVNVTVSQSIWLPQVTITQPKDGDVFGTPGSFTMTATVSNEDGSENPVPFFSGTNLIGSVPAPPYTIVVSNLPAGQHRLTAKYTDNLGNQGTSPDVRVTVTPLVLSGASMAPAGQFRFTVGGLATGNNFEIQASSNLISWSSIATNFASSNIMDFVENTPTSANARYYRVLQNLQ